MASRYDLVVRGGMVVDGSGGVPFAADVAVTGDRIVAVGNVGGRGDEEVEAAGCLVTPGFVDIHTHYDGQAIWSERLTPSSQHGVTTAVVGNCGVGFAPCRSGDHEALISLMEGVEDIPHIVMAAGLTWDWETFPEYLGALERRSHDIDVAAFLPHSPLRVYVMGKRGANRETASDDDLVRMKSIVREALKAGALGVATSRFNLHRTGLGENIPTFEADTREIFAIGEAMKEEGKGVFQVTLDSPEETYRAELELLQEFAVRTGRPVTFSLSQRMTMPELWRDALQMADRANAIPGVQVFPQVATRAVGMIMGLQTSIHPFSLCPSYVGIRDLPLAERVTRMRDPALRAKLLMEKPDDPAMPVFLMARDFENVFRLDGPEDYEPQATDSVASMARAAGVTSEEIVYDALLENDGDALIYSAMNNFAYASLDAAFEMMKHQASVVGLGDGGAHYGFVCDASYPTFLLTHWTRDRQGNKLTLPEAIRALSSRPAQVVGLTDRGSIAPGYKADLNVIDYERLQLSLPHMVNDLPGGGGRLMQGADGYVATIVSGQVIAREGISTGALPGRLVRGAAMHTSP